MKQFLGCFGFIAGATYPWRTLMTFIETPRLWGYLVVPIAINFVLALILYIGGLFWGWQWIGSLTEQLARNSEMVVSDLPLGLSLLQGLVVILKIILDVSFTLVLFGVIGFILTQFGVFLGLPWYGKLSEELERLKTGQVTNLEVSIIKDLGRALLFEGKKIILLVSVGLPLLLFNFIPGWGTLISSFGGVVLSATLIALDFLDAPLERRRLSFTKKLQLIAASLPASAGFSLVCLALISLPLLNLVTIPLCVASGTLFFCDRLMK